VPKIECLSLLLELLFELDDEVDEELDDEVVFKLSFPFFSFPDCEKEVKLIVKSKRTIRKFLGI